MRTADTRGFGMVCCFEMTLMALELVARAVAFVDLEISYTNRYASLTAVGGLLAKPHFRSNSPWRYIYLCMYISRLKQGLVFIAPKEYLTPTLQTPACNNQQV